MSGLSWWSPTTMLIGLPSTLPPKSSIAICADVTEPWPVGVAAGPFMSVRTPILTTSSETCASAAVDASIAAASIPSLDRSEEHTSELQSHHDLVCRLLLEKK